MSNYLSPVEVAKHAYNAGFRGAALIKAVAIAWGESNLNAHAIGDTNLVTEKWGASLGLWQIRSLNNNPASYPYPDNYRDASQLSLPAFNAKAAYAISKKGTDFSHWTVYNNGSYTQYIDRVTEAIKEVGEFVSNNKSSVVGGLIAIATAFYFLTKKKS